MGSSGDELPSGPSAQVVREEDQNKHAGPKKCALVPVLPTKGGHVGGPKGQQVGCSR